MSDTVITRSVGGRLPILILPGWKDRATALRHLVRGLIARGWPADFVTAHEFEDPFGSNIAHAREIAAALDALRLRTGARSVDVVAHSMGGLALRRYLIDAGQADAAVRRAVFLGTPHRGTWVAWLAWGDGAREMRPGSPFLHRLQDSQPPANVRLHCVRTRIDSHVIPGQSAELPQATTHCVTTITHRGLLRHPTIVEHLAHVLADDVTHG